MRDFSQGLTTIFYHGTPVSTATLQNCKTCVPRINSDLTGSSENKFCCETDSIDKDSEIQKSEKYISRNKFWDVFSDPPYKEDSDFSDSEPE